MSKIMSPEKKVWRDLKRRCYMPNTHSYTSYGAKGIIMSKEWKSSFSKFLSDMGEKPSSAHRLGRKDKEGNFCKENCKWMTVKEISLNKSNVRLNWEIVNKARDMYKNTSLSMKDISLKLGFKDKELITRVIVGTNWKDENYTYIKRPYKGNIDPHYHKMKKKYSEYCVWLSMIRRCYCKTYSHYSNYGGRGITVCDEWRKDFVVFITDMGRRPSSKHQIDRIDNDGNYEPGNCRWVTIKENCRNKSNNIIDSHIAEKIRSLKKQGLTHKKISVELGVSYGIVSDVVTGRRWR